MNVTTYKPRKGSHCDSALELIRSSGGRIEEVHLAVALELDPGEVGPALRYGITIGVVVRHGRGKGAWYTEGDAAPPSEEDAQSITEAMAALTKFFSRAREMTQ